MYWPHCAFRLTKEEHVKYKDWQVAEMPEQMNAFQNFSKTLNFWMTWQLEIKTRESAWFWDLLNQNLVELKSAAIG